MTAKEALRYSGKSLKLIRSQKGFSVEALVVLAGVEAEIITKMEAGDFDYYISSVYELAAALNVDLWQILVDSTAFA